MTENNACSFLLTLLLIGCSTRTYVPTIPRYPTLPSTLPHIMQTASLSKSKDACTVYWNAYVRMSALVLSAV